ncbi:MAG: hypothetical protein ACR2L2_18080 [Acidobacteriota bacterium]
MRDKLFHFTVERHWLQGIGGYPMKRLIALIFVVAGLIGCGSDQAQEAQQAPPIQTSPASASAAGVTWPVPARWNAQPERPMRAATYKIPGVQADADAECAVFFFGAGQGGSVEANIQRWIGQFETSETPARSTRQVNGFNVERIALGGTYLASGGMVQSAEPKPNYRLLGAIVEAPEGAVFFKLTGPSATVAAAEAEFDQLVSSIKR